LDLKETRVPMVSLDLKVHLVSREDKGHQDQEESPVKRVKLEFLAFLDLLEEMDCLEFVVYLECLDPKEILGKMV